VEDWIIPHILIDTATHVVFAHLPSNKGHVKTSASTHVVPHALIYNAIHFWNQVTELLGRYVGTGDQDIVSIEATGRLLVLTGPV